MGWHISFSIAAMIFFQCYSSAQLVIDGTSTPEQLVETLVGPGVTFSNVTQPINFFEPGHPWMGSAAFTATGTNLGMEAGILMSTGPVEFAAPWSPTELSTQYIWTYGDDDLTVLSGGTVGSPFAITKDASILEFDFEPNGDSIKFRYVFASDEYPEWVCSQYNDVFGFFLSGPGINGPFSNNSVNLAVIPGTNIPIAVNSVNSGQVGGITFPYPASTCAETDPNWQNNSIYYVDNEFGPYTSYDGFTVVLEATSAVQCGETYHIKLAIADNVDAFYDSAVFLESGSFSATGQPAGVSLVPGIGISGDTLTAGCPAEFLIQRNGDISTAATIDLMVGGTATPGVDHIPAFPTQITFAPGEASQTLIVDVPIDGDPLETIIITLTGLMTCAGISDAELTFYIFDPPPLEVELADVAFGCLDEQVLQPVVSGGAGAYEFLWSTGATTPSITVQPGGATEYEVTVSDGCGVAPVTVNAMVTMNAQPLEIVVSPEVEVLCGQEILVEVTSITGGVAPFSFQWSEADSVVGNGQVLVVTGGATAWYVVTVTDTCGGSVMDSVLVITTDPLPLEVTASDDLQVPCLEQAMISVIDVEGGAGELSYTWMVGSVIVGTGPSLNVAGGLPTWYVVTVVDSCGATGQDSVLVSSLPAPDLMVTTNPEDATVCAGDTVVLQVLDVEGAIGEITYSWSNGEGQMIGTGPTIEVVVVQDEVFMVAISDACIITTVALNVVVAPAFPFPEDRSICPGGTVLVSFEEVAAQVLWDHGHDTLALELSEGSYSYSATDPYGCVHNGSIVISAPAEGGGEVNIPNVITPNHDGINDVLLVEGVVPEGFALEIYDRWGKLMWNSSSPMNGWKGDSNGDSVPDGTYIYVIHFQSLCGSSGVEQHTGHVTVLR